MPSQQYDNSSDDISVGRVYSASYGDQLISPMSDVTMSTMDFSRHNRSPSPAYEENPAYRISGSRLQHSPAYGAVPPHNQGIASINSQKLPPPYIPNAKAPPAYASTQGPQNNRPFQGNMNATAVIGNAPPPSYQALESSRSSGSQQSQRSNYSRSTGTAQLPYQSGDFPSPEYSSPIYPAGQQFSGDTEGFRQQSNKFSSRSSEGSPLPPSYHTASTSSNRFTPTYHSASPPMGYQEPARPGSARYISATSGPTNQPYPSAAGFQQHSAQPAPPQPPSYETYTSISSRGATAVQERCPVDIYTQPKQWFQYFDKDGSGSLDKDECINGLSSTFQSVDRLSIESVLTAFWDQYDPMHTGFVSLSQFTRPDGLCDMVVQQFPCDITKTHTSSASSGNNLPSRKSPVARCPVDIYTQPKQWFQYFDKDNSGSLDKEECSNGFAATFQHVDLSVVRSVVDAIWDQFDPRHTGYVTLTQFTKPGGLCETITCQFPRETSNKSVSQAARHNLNVSVPCPIDIYSQPKQWFQYFDKDNSGALDRDECVNGLASTFQHVDRVAIESVLDAVWDQFDPRHLGFITMAQFTKNDGLCSLITSQFPREISKRKSPKGKNGIHIVVPCPFDIYTQPKQWFQHFDKDNSGSLDRNECAAGLADTFQHVDRSTIESVLSALWAQFDPSQTGFVTLQQFTKRDGLCETILNQLPRKHISRTGSNEGIVRPGSGADSGRDRLTPSGLLNSVGSFFKGSGGKPKSHHHRGIGTHKAVLIGINYYGSSAQLKSGVNDAELMKKLLIENYGWQEKDIRMLHDKTRDLKIRPNKDNIIKMLRWLVKDVRAGDTLFLHFSGHVFQEENIDGNVDDDDDDDGVGGTEKSYLECLVPGKRVILLSPQFY
jgi:Ca2+-binding EF-hand superfamily protein